MSFSITLYRTKSENNRVAKTLYDGVQLTGNLREESDVVHPEILIEGNYIGYNYCYIPEWERYYYIRDIHLLRTNLMRLSLEVDVLMSFKEQIKQESAVIDKQSRVLDANMYIDDGDWVVQNNEFIQIKNFDNGFNNEGEFILIVAGGGLGT